MARDNKLTKSIGEHFVCSALAQVGWAASLTRDGIARTDILAVHVASGTMIQVQVKTSTTWQRPSWLLGNVKRSDQPNEWYVLVALGESVRDRPRCFVAPRDHVSAAVWIAHHVWLHEPGIPAGRRNTTIERARAGVEVFAGYEERWDLLEREVVPVLLPPDSPEHVVRKKIGLPPDHPWREAPPEGWPQIA